MQRAMSHPNAKMITKKMCAQSLSLWWLPLFWRCLCLLYFFGQKAAVACYAVASSTRLSQPHPSFAQSFDEISKRIYFAHGISLSWELRKMEHCVIVSVLIIAMQMMEKVHISTARHKQMHAYRSWTTDGVHILLCQVYLQMSNVSIGNTKYPH